MQNIVQHITLIARTIQGITPIFMEYALWIAIAGLFAFALGEALAYLVRYKDSRIKWVASAYGVHPQDVLPIPSPLLLGKETRHPTSRKSNPFSLIGTCPSPHQGDYIIRGENGTVLVSVYNWRGSRARNARDTQRAGQIEIFETQKARFASGFHRQRVVFSPDEDAKAKAATLSAALVTRHSAQSRVVAMCLHKNRPPHLAARSPHRDVNGKLAAHIDIEQIGARNLPLGQGGGIDEETWRDLRGWLLRQPGRMMSPTRMLGRILTALLLLAIFAHTEASTISPFEIELIMDYLRGLLAYEDTSALRISQPGAR